ncbi:hypothetical protein [Ligilactobacillus sp.]|uniref:hypothetical protein n=1 Tax=Ligilactobacillus sp. TaxID=2767921 RepID=UPI002FE355BB
MTIKEKYAYVFLIRKYLMYELLAIGGIVVIYFGGWLFLSGKVNELTTDWLMFPVTDFLQSMLCVFLLFFYNEFKYFIQNGVTRKEYWRAKMLAAFSTYGINVFLGSTYYFAFQQFYSGNNYLLNVFSISDVSDLPFAVVLYVDGMMTSMLMGCVFSMLEKNGKIILALSLAGVNAVLGAGVFEIDKHNALTSFFKGIGSLIKGVNPVYPAIIYAIVLMEICLLVMKRFKLRLE